ncbi:MAG: LytR C-terminal domain-containing protein [Gracilimonas sp.]|uniref:LytR C-terminal domain-containing protein n=1 Tax=Gracilimonas sediminicola TaxID=2952158 RepID=A0A9X2L3J0_9BACT|nr:MULTISPECIES: LytR C-terminal domain-containing protein [Gracilimonas]MBO6585264.1 LytR C-terminal domain-containing protein [Gracilimonas sp.]MBO6615464.1 LytR C-terminal domain-containing protein [Gracilimonas sp.]MCP9291711.1 LytR C-terminal domain-containing protein [Gracilimonas sediminicola]
MAETKGNSSSGTNELFLNAAIGFLSVLLLVLVAALFTRIIYPRIFNERAELQSELISEIIQIEVLNGCGISGIANSYTGLLRKNGFDVVETGNFETFDLQETLIISRSGVMDNAYRVANALGVPERNVIRESSPDFYLDVSVIIGHDFEKLNTD